MDSEYLKNLFEIETGQGIGYLEGKEPPEENGTYNDAFVEWLIDLFIKQALKSQKCLK